MLVTLVRLDESRVEQTILLLRHQTAPRRVSVREFCEAEFSRAVNNKIFAPPRDMQHKHASPLHGLQNKVAVTDSYSQSASQLPKQPPLKRLDSPYLPYYYR